MKLSHTDFTSLAAIVVGGGLGIALFGPQQDALWSTQTTTVVTIDWTEPTVEIHNVVEKAAPLVYLDGERVDDLSDLRPERVERVEVVKGPAALAVNAEATGGIIYVYTKSSTPPGTGG